MNVRKEMQPSTFIRRCVECIHIGAVKTGDSYTYKCIHPVLAVAPWTTPRQVDLGTIPDWCPLPDAEDEGGDA